MVVSWQSVLAPPWGIPMSRPYVAFGVAALEVLPDVDVQKAQLQAPAQAVSQLLGSAIASLAVLEAVPGRSVFLLSQFLQPPRQVFLTAVLAVRHSGSALV
jgi:hypothetical protein